MRTSLYVWNIMVIKRLPKTCFCHCKKCISSEHLSTSASISLFSYLLHQIVSNKRIWKEPCSRIIHTIAKERNWRWLCFTLRKPKNIITKRAYHLSWEDSRNRRRARSTWWWKSGIKYKLVRNHGLRWILWKKFVVSLCYTKKNKQRNDVNNYIKIDDFNYSRLV